MKDHVDETRYSKAAGNYIKKLSKPDREMLREKIHEHLEILPADGDIKPMQGFKDGRMRLRLGSIRIIFKYDEEGTLLILYIIDAGPRGDIYK